MESKKYFLEICFPGLDHRIPYHYDDTNTLGDLRKQLTRVTIVPSENQKLLLNGQPIKFNSATLLKDIANSGSKTSLFLVAPKTRSDYQRERQDYLWTQRKRYNLERHSINKLTTEVENAAGEAARKHKLLNGLMTKECLDIFARNLFQPSFWKDKAEKVLGDERLLEFILNKKASELCAGNKETQYILSLMKGSVVKAIIGGHKPIIESDHDPAPTFDPTLCTQIVEALEFPKDKAIEALHRYMNNFYKALKWLRSEGNNADDTDEQCKQVDEEFFIYHWLTRKDHEDLKMRLALHPQQIEIYLNSLKLRSPKLFNIFKRHRNFTWKVLRRVTAKSIASAR